MLKVKTIALMDWTLICNTEEPCITVTPCPGENPVNATTTPSPSPQAQQMRALKREKKFRCIFTLHVEVLEETRKRTMQENHTNHNLRNEYYIFWGPGN